MNEPARPAPRSPSARVSYVPEEAPGAWSPSLLAREPPGASFSFEARPGAPLREVLDIVWTGRWIALLIAAAVTALGVAYALTATPRYLASGLVQVEQEQNTLSASVDKLSSLFSGSGAGTGAEIALIKSRMVLGVVGDQLKLYIYVDPKRPPMIGGLLARWHARAASPAAPWFGMSSYAWGGEQYKISVLNIPPSQAARSLRLVALDSGRYEIRDDQGSAILTEQVGRLASQEFPDGHFDILVNVLQARPGTEFRIARLQDEDVYNTLEGRVQVSEEPRDSGVIRIRYEDSNSVLAASVINEIQNAYLHQNIQRRSAQAEQSLEFLKQQLPDLKMEVEKARARLNRYQSQKGSVDVEHETQLVLNETLSLQTERLHFMQELRAAQLKYTDEHPTIITLKEQIDEIDEREVQLRKQVETLPQTQQEIFGLMRDLSVNTDLYTALLNSAQQLQITKAGTIGNVRIVDRALPPGRPSKPNKSMIVAVAVFIGSFLGVAAVFFARALQRGVDRPEDLERALGIPTLASIPYSGAERRLSGRRRGSENSLLASLNSSDLAIEALRSLRTSLHFAALDAPNNVIMFTGPIASLGKSFVTFNLGAVMANFGERIVVIDGDLRRGRLHRYAGIGETQGLSDYISGRIDRAQLVRKTSIDQLDFIPGGTRPENPAEILSSAAFAELIGELSSAYDYVLIDTPPVLPVADASIIGRLAGTTMLVLKSAEHPLRAIEETIRRLQSAGIGVRGAVFNQVGARIGSYGYGAYGYAYGYSTYGYGSSDKHR